MKKITKLVLTLLIFSLVLVGCGSSDDNKINDIVGENSGSTVESDTDNVAEDITDDNASAEAEEELFEVFSHNNLTISTDKKFTITDVGIEFALWIDNATEQNLTVMCEGAAVNLYMVDEESFIGDVEAGTKAKIDGIITKASLERSEIEEVAQLDLWLKIYDPATMDDFCDISKISIETEAAERIEVVELDEGTQIYNNNDIRIVTKGIVKDDALGTWLEIYIENNTDKQIAVTAKNVKVNGTDTEVLMYGHVYPQRMSVENLQFYNSALIVDGTNEIVFELQIVEKNPTSIIDKTEPITVTAE